MCILDVCVHKITTKWSTLSLQVLVAAFNFILTLTQSAMLYITLLITTLSQLCVQLFHAVVNLDWPLILEYIGETCALATNTLLDGLSLTLSAIVYIISGLAAVLLKVATLISSLLVYCTKGFLALAQNAVHSVQFLFADKPLMSDKTVVSLLLGGFGILWIYVLYSLVIFCIRGYLRRQQAKNRRHLLRNEANARRPIAVDQTGPPARPPRVELRADPLPIRRRNRRFMERENAPRRMPHDQADRILEGMLEDRFGNDGRLRANERSDQVDALSRLLVDNYSSLKEGKSSSKYVKPNVKDPRLERCASSTSIDESVDDLIMHAKMQELETQLMREKEAKQCVVCLDRPRVVMMRPCNHYCICEECSKHLSRCPICTNHFTRMEKVFNV